MILASNSPRRKEILESFGFGIKIITEEVEEISDKKDVVSIVEDIAMKKGSVVADKYQEETVVSADTVVVYDGEILGKPKDEEDAIKTLKLLSGKKHKVITSYAIFNRKQGVEEVRSVKTSVKFKILSEKEIKWYVESKEPLDKAGSYGIQGLGNVFVEGIKGDFFNVMGFPLSHFYDTLVVLGYDIEKLKEI